MADTETPAAVPASEYLSRPVGTFGIMGGLPADYGRDQVLNRAGVPQGDKLRAKLKYTHASNNSPEIDRLPDPFPPASFTGPLVTAKDYLALIDSTAKPGNVSTQDIPDADVPIVQPAPEGAPAS